MDTEPLAGRVTDKEERELAAGRVLAKRGEEARVKCLPVQFQYTGRGFRAGRESRRAKNQPSGQCTMFVHANKHTHHLLREKFLGFWTEERALLAIEGCSAD